MITPKMTYQEIADIFKREFLEEVKRGYDSCFGQVDKLARMARKANSSTFHLLHVHTKRTKQMNDFVVLFFTREKPRKGEPMIRRTVYLKYLLSDGIHVANAHPNALDEVTFYTPHFFDRYRERQLKNPSLPKTDVINHFMAITAATSIKDINNPKYPNSVYGTNEEGVLLGENLGNGLFEFRTFISFEMLGDDQILRSIIQQESNDELKSNIEHIQRLAINLSRNL